jgi:hypothetical protein
MKAIIIKPETKSIEEIEVADLGDITKLIGFDSVISDAIDDDGNYLYFDEDCFLRGTEGRFQIDSMIPVSGVGIIMGASDDGATLRDVSLSVEDITARLKYL